MNDLAEIEQLAGNLLRRVSAADRRRLLRAVSRDLRKSQSARIGRQQAPDGSPFPERRAKKEPKPGNHAAKFLYPKGAAEPRLVFMTSWVREGDTLTGYDTEAGAVRTFAWDRVDRFLPIERGDKAKPGGRFRRKGRIRRKAMFRKLRLGRYLKEGATADEAWVGFSGRVARIARVHQDGLDDKPAPNAKTVRYARRELLGLTEAERREIIDTLLAHVAGF